MIFVIAVSTLKESCRAEFIRLAKANIPTVRAEEGCISYELTEDDDSGFSPVDKNVLTFVECWESPEHLRKHLAAPHMKAFCEKVKDLRVSSSLRVITPVRS